MFQSDLSDIVERRDRVRTDWRFFSQFKISCQKIEILARVVDLFLIAATARARSWPVRTLLGQRGLSTDGLSLPVTIHGAPLTAFERSVKRTLDVVGSMTAILFLWPLLLVVAIAVKLDSSGPIIFQQRRTGFNGKEFVIFKFRTMTVLEDGEAITQACRGDLRATRVGKFLRRSSIDELPQLFNVLAGSMSLIGPRPHALIHDTEFDKVVSNYAFRHRVKPGITGWAQVHGCRGPTPTPRDIERRVEYDLWYVDNWSFGLDCSILVRTVVEVLRGRNAC
jgi:exopolysaccharide biosynthesis polyprenyl glycosylphosphotransferase